MIRRLFLDHPRSVGESYAEHAAVAAGFGVAMIAGGVACLVHAFVPGLFVRTGSNTIRRLHAAMAVRTPAAPAAPPARHTPATPAWQLEYEI